MGGAGPPRVGEVRCRSLGYRNRQQRTCGGQMIYYFGGLDCQGAVLKMSSTQPRKSRKLSCTRFGTLAQGAEPRQGSSLSQEARTIASKSQEGVAPQGRSSPGVLRSVQKGCSQTGADSEKTTKKQLVKMELF